MPVSNLAGQSRISLKRDKKIGNKMELTRLQQHFESCVKDVKGLEAAKKREKLQPLIEEKYEEIYEICEKGNSLL